MKTLREYINIITEASEVPYFVDVSSGKPMAKTGAGMTAIVASKLWTAVTPDVIARAEAQGFRRVMLQHNNRQFMGLEGGDMKLGSKIIVAPSDYATLVQKSPAGGL